MNLSKQFNKWSSRCLHTKVKDCWWDFAGKTAFLTPQPSISRKWRQNQIAAHNTKISNLFFTACTWCLCSWTFFWLWLQLNSTTD